MRLLFIADARSPIAMNWIRYFLGGKDEVHLVSTFPASPEAGLASFTVIPVAFSSLKRSRGETGSNPMLGKIAVRSRTFLRQWFGPLTLNRAAVDLRRVINNLQPDMVHAMRIPYEGMLAAIALAPQPAQRQPRQQTQIPFMVSVWGNDFTLHAPSTPLMRQYTQRTLSAAAALHTDCQRDLHLAHTWGFDNDKPSLVVPGAGGIQLDLFSPPPSLVIEPLVINARGFRAYVNNQAFFQAAALVLTSQPAARFICPSMLNEPQAQRWVNDLGIASAVELLPAQSRAQMAGLFRRARIAVSPSNHDGTPNTLLEAMACGCLPVAGNLESIREWITDNENGLLVDPNAPPALAEAILSGFKNDELYLHARDINRGLIAQRAEYHSVMLQARNFYRSMINL